MGFVLLVDRVVFCHISMGYTETLRQQWWSAHFNWLWFSEEKKLKRNVLIWCASKNPGCKPQLIIWWWCCLWQVIWTETLQCVYSDSSRMICAVSVCLNVLRMQNSVYSSSLCFAFSYQLSSVFSLAKLETMALSFLTFKILRTLKNLRESSVCISWAEWPFYLGLA